METTECIYCTECSAIVKKIIAVVPTEMELIWNDLSQCYEINLYDYQFERPVSVICGTCNSNLLNSE